MKYSFRGGMCLPVVKSDIDNAGTVDRTTTRETYTYIRSCDGIASERAKFQNSSDTKVYVHEHTHDLESNRIDRARVPKSGVGGGVWTRIFKGAVEICDW